MQFDRYVAGTSLLHQLDARVKLSLTLLAIISNVWLPDAAWLAFALMWGVSLLASVLADLGLTYAVRRSFVALPFALAALSVIFTLPGQPVFGLSVGPWHLTGTDSGMVRFASIVLRSWISVQLAIVLVAATPFPHLVHALRHLHVPTLLVAIVSLMYRYLAVLADETLRLLRARASRSARPIGASAPPLQWQARVAGHMVGQLFLRSYERSDRIYAAMLARGYKGQPLALHSHVLRRADWAIMGGVGLVLVLVQVVGRVPLV